MQLVTFVKMCPFFIDCERDLEEERDAKFDMSMMNFSKFEGPVEKQLRETGEWVTNQTERGFRSNGNLFSFLSAKNGYIFGQEKDEHDTASSICFFFFVGKNILKFVFLWILPIWAFSLLVAAGTIKLNIPLLDDLIM